MTATENSLTHNQNLKNYNTFAMNVAAKQFFVLTNIHDNLNFIQDKINANNYLILGGGSNILFTKNFPGLIIYNCIKGIFIEKEDDDYVCLKIGAGENWHQLVLYCVQHHYAGIENLALIPGTVGAAPIQNIGAYGAELKDVFVSLQAFNISTKKIETFVNQDCELGYRDSIFKRQAKDQFIILHVTLKLSKKPKFNLDYGIIKETLNEMNIKSFSIIDVANAVIKIRQTKLPDPAQLPNAGSFFKNPYVDMNKMQTLKQQYASMPTFPVDQNTYKIPAGWLIEQCGWKGKRLGNVGVYEKQALVLANYANASGNEILQLAKTIQQDVLQKFSIKLEPEVNII